MHGRIPFLPDTLATVVLQPCEGAFDNLALSSEP